MSTVKAKTRKTWDENQKKNVLKAIGLLSKKIESDKIKVVMCELHPNSMGITTFSIHFKDSNT